MMPMGHTDRATINKRRPLTENMTELLRSLDFQAKQRGPLRGLTTREMTQAEKNAAKALMDRSLIGWDDDIKVYYINDAGRTALSSTRG
jgi:hypothetical protein